MNTTQLKYFHTVATFHSVSEAAAYLHISQPSLSATIKELENEFGVFLFLRHHRGMTLTPEGEILFRLSGDILERMEQAEERMRDLGNGKKRLRLGVPPMIGSLILPKIYRDFVPREPEISLEITEGGRRELMEKLKEDQVDMMFLPHSDPIDPSYSTLKLAEIPIVCCVPKNSPIATLSSVRPSDLIDVPLVLFENSFFQTEKIKKWFSDSNVTPQIILQTEQLSTMLSVLAGGIATGFVFSPLVAQESNLIPIHTNTSLCVDVSLIWKKDAYLFSSMKIFKEYVKTASLLGQLRE